VRGFREGWGGGGVGMRAAVEEEEWRRGPSGGGRAGGGGLIQTSTSPPPRDCLRERRDRILHYAGLVMTRPVGSGLSWVVRMGTSVAEPFRTNGIKFVGVV